MANLPLHEGLILLIYDHIKTHSIGKFQEVKMLEETDDSELEGTQDLSNIEDSEGLHMKEDMLGIKTKGKGKIATHKTPVMTQKNLLPLGKNKKKKIKDLGEE